MIFCWLAHAESLLIVKKMWQKNEPSYDLVSQYKCVYVCYLE